MPTATARADELTREELRAGAVRLTATVARVAPRVVAVVGVTAYDRLDEAVDLANDSRYGLQAAVFTADIATALDSVRRLDFGGVLVNEVPTWRADQQPYGGVRDSGNTREGPAYAVEELTERRMVVLQG